MAVMCWLNYAPNSIYKALYMMLVRGHNKGLKQGQLAHNVLHKTSKGMREMNYQDLQHFERATMPKLPIQPLLVLCGVTTRFCFSLNSEIETLTIKADGVAEASIYWYLDDYSTVYLSNLIVYPQLRNKGIGEKLQVIREQIGKDLNANTSCLWVKKESWMFEWYQRRGYSELKTHARKGFVWMTKPLL
jgi:GNAT superfamily N-acetyltransferase